MPDFCGYTLCIGARERLGAKCKARKDARMRYAHVLPSQGQGMRSPHPFIGLEAFRLRRFFAPCHSLPV